MNRVAQFRLTVTDCHVLWLCTVSYHNIDKMVDRSNGGLQLEHR